MQQSYFINTLVYVLHGYSWKPACCLSGWKICFWWNCKREQDTLWDILLIRRLSGYSIYLACPYAGESVKERRKGDCCNQCHFCFLRADLRHCTLWFYPCVTQDAFSQDLLSQHCPFSSILFGPLFLSLPLSLKINSETHRCTFILLAYNTLTIFSNAPGL